jgi:predicted phage terminase large subunit-like protein
MCDHLAAVSSGEIRRLLINVPPGCMKSLLVATLWPAWDWIDHPTRRFIYATYAQDISNKNAILHRNLVNSSWYAERYPHVRIRHEDVKTVHNFENSLKGWRNSTSVTGAATGRHGDVLVFDDLVKAQDADGKNAVTMEAIKKANLFWTGTMSTRRAVPAQTRYVGIMQRLHHADVSAICEAQGYTVLRLPMEFEPRRRCVIPSTGFADPRTEKGELLWPERFSADDVADLRKLLGPLAASAQLDQNPTKLEGDLFKRDSVTNNRWNPKDAPQILRRIVTVDCTFKDLASSDYVVAQAWGVYQVKGVGRKYVLLDQIRGQWTAPETAKQVKTFAKRVKALGVYVEDKANGPAIVQLLRGQVTGLREWSPGKSSKDERASAVSDVFAVDCLFPPDTLAPWLEDYISELTQFPRGLHDDQVDATTMALLILAQGRGSRMRAGLQKLAGG